MTDGSIYKDIAERTGGEIHVGVVGPVRSGKSTFIKKFMELFVIPGIENTYMRTRVIDQLPQSGDGRTITTVEPKFVPEEAVKIRVGNTVMSVRMADCAGFIIPGVLGHTEGGKSRMVKTPWDDDEMPFETAAEKGTSKVIADHSTVGIVVTCDGSFGEIPRENFIKAEERTVSHLQKLGKPFVIVMNTVEPESYKTIDLCKKLSGRYETPVIPVNCETMDKNVPVILFREILRQFPATEIFIDLPEYMDALPSDHWIKAGLVETILAWMSTVETIGNVEESVQMILTNENVSDVKILECEMATGRIAVGIKLREGLYYRIIEELLGSPVSDDRQLFMLLREYAFAKKSYDDMAEAMVSVEKNGYGIVHPKLQQMDLGHPEVFRHGNKFGVRLVATAPCLHIIRTDITTEVSPIVGSEQQSEDLAEFLKSKFDNDDDDIWNTNLFGKTLQDMVAEQMNVKLTSMPESLQLKVQKSLQKISNEGKDYFICIIL